jgi:hypothetical protein
MHAQNVNLADTESGYTALHRSIAYGFINVAVALMQASMKIISLVRVNSFSIISYDDVICR